MCRSVFLCGKVDIVGCYDFNPAFLRQFKNGLVYNGLLLVYLVAHPRHLCLVKLDFQIVIVAEEFLVPENALPGPGNVAFPYLLRNFTGKAGR